MLILFDHGTPRGVARFLSAHTITEAKTRGWDTLTNGELLQAAEEAGFDVLLTTDQNLRYQQNLSGRRVAVVILGQARWRLIEPMGMKIAAAVDAAQPGGFTLVEIQAD